MQLPGVLLRRPWVVATVTCLAVPGPAFGQRADENAVTAAQDAFGTSIGFQSVGLYSANDARGFSPQQAGNLRIEGLWAASPQWNRLSPRVATTDNGTYLPALATLAAGVRYRRTLRSHPWTARLDGFNLTDARGLHVSSLDLVLPEQSRRFMLTLATNLLGAQVRVLPAITRAQSMAS